MVFFSSSSSSSWLDFLQEDLWRRLSTATAVKGLVWSGLEWLLRLSGSSSCAVSLWGWLCESSKRWRWLGGWCSDRQQQVSTTGGGQCGRYWGPWGSFSNVSLVPLCHSSQWRVHHRGLSWAGNSPPPFWGHALPIIAVASAKWPLCWWFLPDQRPQHWRRSYSHECWGWCRDNAEGCAQGVIDGGGRLPMTQNKPGFWKQFINFPLFESKSLLSFCC